MDLPKPAGAEMRVNFLDRLFFKTSNNLGRGMCVSLVSGMCSLVFKIVVSNVSPAINLHTPLSYNKNLQFITLLVEKIF